MNKEPESTVHKPDAESADDNPFVAYVGALLAFSTRKEIDTFIEDLRGDEFDSEKQQ